ncbi:hypothetical protein L5515_013106 [Caenorhabditis briggsae]|uniref:cGMP-dependent protein kinase interacting domain-containing protein n=1 Tax=Caenorhabditis briggsae TaxID=6238 RepID=A0AAE9J512_CAEBR|nr:hypothetical protein L5515_013106 [Caenorhabditis briggsae]
MGQDDEDDAQMLQAKQQITFNVVNKRKDQLRRWQSSEMNAEPARRMKRPKVQFQDSDIFLSACMSGDEEEVEELLLKGADINTCTVDGLTALHQSVIDSKPEMVRFLCEKGADVNAQDNEGWTPLHAAACCGNVSIVRYLCQHGADLSVVNSDKELALDLAVDEQCREYLEDDYKRQMIDLEACREQELATMLKDVKMWISQGEYRDVPHHRTGGTAMHVAAGRGYTQLLELLIKAGGNVRAQDKEGWTPLHAASHWAERDACKILLENGAELSDLTFTGIDVLGVADKECIDYLVELADTVKSQAKRKSPGGGSGSMVPPASVLQEKNQRISHEEHVLSTERKRDLQHKDQYSENEYLHHSSIGSTASSSSTTTSSQNLTNSTSSATTIRIGDNDRESRESAANSEVVEVEEEEEDEEVEDVEAEDEMEADEEEAAEDEQSEDVKKMETSPVRSETGSRSLSMTRSLDGYTDRSSSARESSVETASEAATSSGSGTTASSRFTPSSTPSSQRSASVHSQETPRSSLRFQEATSSIGSGDQTVSATVPIAPLSAPPKAVHQSPSSWINRGVPLSSRSSTSSVSRASSTPVSDIISPPASLNSPYSLLHHNPSSSASTTVTPTPSTVPSTPTNSNVMAATISSSAKNTPSPAGSVTITATFTKPSSSRNPSEELYRSPSQPTNVPWASLWHNVNNASTGQIRTHIEQLRNASSSSLSSYYPRVSAFRPIASSRTPSQSSVGASSPATIAEYPRGFVPQQINPNKMSRWQSKTVTESEAERRNNSRMQRQHRRSTQGVTKEQLEEASRFATDEVARRNSQVLSSQPTTPTSGGASYSNTLLQPPSARLASEEKDLSSYSDDQHVGDVTTSATVSLMNTNSPSSNNNNSLTNSANVRRKSQGLSISRSNRRATGPVNAEDLAPTMGLRLATAQVPYSARSTAAGTLPTMSTTSRLSTSSSEKASSLPPGGGGQTNGITQSTTQSLSSRSAVVAGLSPAPSMRTPIGPLSNTTATSTSSRYMPSSSLSSNGSSANNQPIYGLQSRPTETNLNYKALFEKERTECERLRREMDDMRRSQTIEPWRGSSSTQSPAWRTRGASPSATTIQNLSVAKSTSLASFDENERRSMERKIADLELQLKTTQNLRMENQRLKEENGALVRVISKMTI